MDYYLSPSIYEMRIKRIHALRVIKLLTVLFSRLMEESPALFMITLTQAKSIFRSD